jgi:hypothetical protein
MTTTLFKKTFTPNMVKKLRCQIILLLLAWTTIQTILHGWHPMHGWAQANWLINYEWGFIKRGIWGTIMQPLINSGWQNKSALEIMSIISYPIFITTIGALFIVIYDINKKTKNFTSTIILGFLFFASPYIEMTANTLGYLDQIILILGISSIAIAQKSPLASSIILSISILIHEATFLTSYPVFVFFIICTMINTQNHIENREKLLKAVAITLPAITLSTLIIYTHIYPVSEATGHAIYKKISTTLDTAPAISKIFTDYFTTSFQQFLIEELPKFPDRMTDPLYAPIYYAFVGIFVFIITWNTNRLRPVIAILATISCIAPWSMHAIATDTPRIWSMAIPYTLLTLWSATKSGVISDLKIPLQIKTIILALFCTFIFYPPMLMIDASFEIRTEDIIKNLTASILIMCYLTAEKDNKISISGVDQE